MKMRYIKVRGAIGFKKGLGVDEVEFDLQQKTGLVALSGPNGKGKTTLLELMSPYRTFASRNGALRHHFFLRDSFIETRFEYNGRLFNTIRKIDSGSDRAEAFIVVDGESVVNGKLKEYDEYIINLFGSQALFYNSVFCAQGSGNMSDMRTGEIKELFVEFLRIERLVEYETKAKAGISFFQKKLDILSGQIEVLEESISFFDNIDSDIKNKSDEIEGIEISIKSCNEYIKMMDKNITELKKEEAAQENDILRKKEIEPKLEKLIAERNEVQRKIETLKESNISIKADVQKDLDAVNMVLSEKDKILNASSRIEKLKRGEKHFSECFECAIDEQGRQDKTMKDMDAMKEIASNQIEALKNDLITDGLVTTSTWIDRIFFDVENEQEEFVRKLIAAEKDFDLIQAKNEIKVCKEKIAMAIDPDCTSTICPAIALVNDAIKDLPGLEEKYLSLKAENEKIIQDLEEKISACIEKNEKLGKKRDALNLCLDEQNEIINKKIESLEMEIETFETAKKKATSAWLTTGEFKTFYKQKVSWYRDMILELEELAAKKPQIEVSEEKKRGIEKDIKRLDADYEERMSDLSKQFDALSENILGFENEILKINTRLSTNDIHDRIRIKTDERDRLEEKKDGLTSSLDQLKQSLAILKNDLVKKKENVKSLKEKKKTLQSFQKELSEWDYLRLACSKTGLQALEIDGAAPLIVSEANTLLEHAFGLDYQIRIVTQDPESGREVFWIKVIRDDGSEDDFSNLSGGQKVWIAKALSLGMTLVSKRKSGRDFRTLFADEEDGALDSEKAIEFIHLYRSMMATGDFETCFFISHNSDVVAMADHEIQF